MTTHITSYIVVLNLSEPTISLFGIGHKITRLESILSGPPFFLTIFLSVPEVSRTPSSHAGSRSFE